MDSDAQIKYIYAVPRVVDDVRDCFFYHTMDIPGYGVVQAEWDLRLGVDKYLGYVPLKGKRVLEIGTASGFLCFQMEKMGADVVAYDLSEDQSWDIVPSTDLKEVAADRKVHIRMLNNGFWLAHGAHRSKAKMVYGSIYSIPKEIGIFDVSTVCSVLLHVRDPFFALQNIAGVTQNTIVVTDRISWKHIPLMMLGKISRPCMQFLPDAHHSMADTWWRLTPDVIARFLEVLGFERVRILYHRQSYKTGKKCFFTVVGERAKDFGASQ